LAIAGSRCSQIRADTIHHEVVGVRPLSVHAELTLLIKRRRGGKHNPGRQIEKRTEAPTVERQIRDEAVVNKSTYGDRRRIERGRTGLHHDRFGGRADPHLEVDVQNILYMQIDHGFDHGFETGFLNLQAIGARRKVR
jgi:hypothetical protein